MVVLIPAFNEEEALPRALRSIPPGRVDHVLVVNNGSTDATEELARAQGCVVVSEPRRGYGAACLAGIERLAGLEPPPEVLVFMDADAEVEASYLSDLLGPIHSGEADLVVGVRSVGEDGSPVRVPLHARVGNGLVLALVNLFFGCRFRDFGPFRAITVPALERLEMDDRDWGWTLQMQLRACRRNLRIREVPIPYGGRVAGRSKISGTVSGSLRAGSKMLYTVVREALRS